MADDKPLRRSKRNRDNSTSSPPSSPPRSKRPRRNEEVDPDIGMQDPNPRSRSFSRTCSPSRAASDGEPQEVPGNASEERHQAPSQNRAQKASKKKQKAGKNGPQKISKGNDSNLTLNLERHLRSTSVVFPALHLLESLFPFSVHATYPLSVSGSLEDWDCPIWMRQKCIGLISLFFPELERWALAVLDATKKKTAFYGYLDNDTEDRNAAQSRVNAFVSAIRTGRHPGWADIEDYSLNPTDCPNNGNEDTDTMIVVIAIHYLADIPLPAKVDLDLWYWVITELLARATRPDPPMLPGGIAQFLYSQVVSLPLMSLFEANQSNTKAVLRAAAKDALKVYDTAGWLESLDGIEEILQALRNKGKEERERMKRAVCSLKEASILLMSEGDLDTAKTSAQTIGDETDTAANALDAVIRSVGILHDLIKRSWETLGKAVRIQ